MNDKSRRTLAKMSAATVDVARIGVAFIPLAGGGVAEVISVLEERRYRRAQRLLERLIAELGDRVRAAEERLGDGHLADLLDDAFERAASTRADEHIDLIARVVADALLGTASPEQLDRHHLLVRMASELLPSHFLVLTEIGTARLVNGEQYGTWPGLGIAHTTKTLAQHFPGLAEVVEPLVGDLLAAGLAMFTPPDATEEIAGTLRGTAALRKEPQVELAPYGKWVLVQLAQLQRERTSAAGTPSAQS